MKKTKLTPRRAADNLFTYLALIVRSVIFLFPCLWLILASLSKTGSLYDFKGFFRRSTASRPSSTCLPMM